MIGNYFEISNDIAPALPFMMSLNSELLKYSLILHIKSGPFPKFPFEKR